MDLLFFLKKVEDYECDIGGAKRTNWRNAKRTCLDWQAHLADGSQHWYLFCDVACFVPWSFPTLRLFAAREARLPVNVVKHV